MIPTVRKKLPKIILGSSSPRRQELLSRICPFDVMKPDTIEKAKKGELPRDYAARNAREKGQWVLSHFLKNQSGQEPTSDVIVISADTIVVVDQHILEKPEDEKVAATMLRQLSGRSHTVISGICVIGSFSTKSDNDLMIEKIVETEVNFKVLSEAEIAAYIRTGEPFDKAGAYAAQGIGSYMVKSIVGSYSNVVGLAMCELVEILEKDFKLDIWN